MQSSKRLAFAVALVLGIGAHASRAHAQQQAQGFALERLYPSAPGAGWFVMDTLDLYGGLGGAISLNLDYERDPLRVRDDAHHLAVVSDQAMTDIGFAITYRRWRFYLDLDLPLVITGQSGTVDGYAFTAPKVNLADTPDTLTDPRIGVDVRIFGGPRSRFRFGMGAQLFVPDYKRTQYVTDGTFRGMVRALFAGDVGRFTYAAQLGAHIRPLDDSSIPGSPKGSELLFGAAAGVRLPLGHVPYWAVVLGPEIFGATAFKAFFTSNGTALEGLLSARFEGTREDKMQVRVKLGAGVGLNPHFGAPEWRLTLGVEMFNHNLRPRSVPRTP
jgi:hypothetical protein